MDLKVYQITSPYFCAGFVMIDGKVNSAAPIIHYIYKWTLGQIKTYCNKKGWELIEVS